MLKLYVQGGGRQLRQKGPLFALITGFVLVLAGIGMASLTDIAGHFAAPAIAALQARGLLHGTGANRFEPDGPLTRAQVAKLFVNGLDQEADATLLSGYASRFVDIPQGHWATGFVEVLAEMGIATGYPDGTFQPDRLVTRAELTVMLVRAAGLEAETVGLRQATLPYVDGDQVESWARRYVAVAQRQGLLQGFPDGSFRPGAIITRAEGALIMTRLMMMRGSLFYVAGTLVATDEAKLVIRDALGRERNVALAPDTVVYRGGVQVRVPEMQVADQVWVVADPDGVARFVEARYHAVEGKPLAVTGQRIRYRLPESGAEREAILEPGALIFMNGRPAAPAALARAERLSLVLNQATGEVRIAEGMAIDVTGLLIGVDVAKRLVHVEDGEDSRALPMAPDAIFFLDGRRVDPDEVFLHGEMVAALDETGKVIYAEVTGAIEE